MNLDNNQLAENQGATLNHTFDPFDVMDLPHTMVWCVCVCVCVCVKERDRESEYVFAYERMKYTYKTNGNVNIIF